MNLDGVVGDRRKALEPTWTVGMEPMYQPVCCCAPDAAVVVGERIRMAEFPSFDPT